MRRIDAIGIALGALLAGGVAYGVLQWAGLDRFDAGIGSQVLLVGGLLGWLASYVLRVVGGNMTYHQQLRNHQDAVLEQQLAQMSDDEIAALQAEVERERGEGTCQ